MRSGSAAIAHSAAKTAYPVREGIVALLEPFIDTVVICTMTALVIVITGVYTGEQAKAVGDQVGTHHQPRAPDVRLRVVTRQVCCKHQT